MKEQEIIGGKFQLNKMFWFRSICLSPWDSAIIKTSSVSVVQGKIVIQAEFYWENQIHRGIEQKNKENVY